MSQLACHSDQPDGLSGLRHLAKHLLMCAPMLAIGVVLLASGVGVVAILPVLGCVLMMTLMMATMGRSGGGGG